jgi:long-subunit fatty acid transport protein
LIHNAVNDNDQTIDDVYTSWLGENETVSPNLWVSERGNIVSYDFSAGANISNQFYLGLTLAVTDINYQLSSFYKETFENNDHIGLKNDFQTTGSGYQVNVGAIWRPADFLRLGIAYHSPTYYTLTDRYFGHATASYTFGDGSHSNDWAKSPEDAYTDYHFNTPYSWVFSAAGILGTKAIISADYEVKDYTNMNLMDIYQVENTIDNHNIDRDFKVASTLRAGFEYRFTPQFSGRLGYSWVENPYEKGFKNKFADPGIVGTVPHFVLEGDTHYYTAGIGYRITSQWYLDVAFVYRTQTDDLYYFPKYWIDGDDGTPFALVDSSPAKLKNTGYKGLITLGYKF